MASMVLAIARNAVRRRQPDEQADERTAGADDHAVHDIAAKVLRAENILEVAQRRLEDQLRGQLDDLQRRFERR